MEQIRERPYPAMVRIGALIAATAATVAATLHEGLPSGATAPVIATLCLFAAGTALAWSRSGSGLMIRFAPAFILAGWIAFSPAAGLWIGLAALVVQPVAVSGMAGRRGVEAVAATVAILGTYGAARLLTHEEPAGGGVQAAILSPVLYLVLSGNYEPGNLLAGLVIALLVTALVRPRPQRVELSRLPSALVALVRYLFLLAYDVVTSGLQVARIVLNPALPIKPGIVAIPTDCRSELSIALSAHAVSVAPGELVIEIGDDGVMYTHVLDATRSSAYVQEAQRIRESLLSKIFI